MSADAEVRDGDRWWQSIGGAWANASVARAEASVGPVGAHVDLNANTGAGFRGGNLDVHVLGFGGKVGADGLTVDTPVGGAKCIVM